MKKTLAKFIAIIGVVTLLFVIYVLPFIVYSFLGFKEVCVTLLVHILYSYLHLKRGLNIHYKFLKKNDKYYLNHDPLLIIYYINGKTLVDHYRFKAIEEFKRRFPGQCLYTKTFTLQRRTENYIAVEVIEKVSFWDYVSTYGVIFLNVYLYKNKKLLSILEEVDCRELKEYRLL